MLPRMKLLITRVVLVLLALCVAILLWAPTALLHLLVVTSEGRTVHDALAELYDQAWHDYHNWRELVKDPFGESDEDEVNGV